MRTIASAIASAMSQTFIYERVHMANHTLDTTTLPAIILLEPESGSLIFNGNSLWERNTYTFQFINQTSLDDSADNNDTIFSSLKATAKEFLCRLQDNTSIEGKIETMDWTKIRENKYDVNVIGYEITVQATLDATSRCY